MRTLFSTSKVDCVWHWFGAATTPLIALHPAPIIFWSRFAFSNLSSVWIIRSILIYKALWQACHLAVSVTPNLKKHIFCSLEKSKTVVDHFRLSSRYTNAALNFEIIKQLHLLFRLTSFYIDAIQYAHTLDGGVRKFSVCDNSSTAELLSPLRQRGDFYVFRLV